MGLYSLISGAFWVGTVLMTIFAIYLYIKCVIIPKKKMKQYEREGFPSMFFLFLGSFRREKKYEKLTKDVMGFYRELAQTKPNTPALISNFGSRIDAALFDPKLIKEFYTNQQNYARGFTTKGMEDLTGKGLFVAEGELWKKHRKVVSSVFHYEFLRENVPLIASTTRELLTKLAQKGLNNVDINKELNGITGEIVGRTFFSERLSEYTLKGQPLTLYLAGLLERFPRVFRNPKMLFLIMTGQSLQKSAHYRAMLEEIKEFRKICRKIVEDRKASGKTNFKDMVGELLRTQDPNQPGESFSDEEIIDEFVTFFLAGMETTGQLSTMMLYLLHKHPQCLETVEKEVKVHYNGTGPITIDQVNSMETLHGVAKEALRLYSPAPQIPARVATVDHQLGDLKIKKGMFVRPVVLFNNSNSKYFDEPEKFMPERWLDKNENKSDPFTFIPFSAGARNCIGQHFAVMEAKIIVAEFLNMFKFKIPDMYDLTMTFVTVYKPKEKILLDLELK